MASVRYDPSDPNSPLIQIKEDEGYWMLSILGPGAHRYSGMQRSQASTIHAITAQGAVDRLRVQMQRHDELRGSIDRQLEELR